MNKQEYSRKIGQVTAAILTQIPEDKALVVHCKGLVLNQMTCQIALTAKVLGVAFFASYSGDLVVAVRQKFIDDGTIGLTMDPTGTGILQHNGEMSIVKAMWVQ